MTAMPEADAYVRSAGNGLSSTSPKPAQCTHVADIEGIEFPSQIVTACKVLGWARLRVEPMGHQGSDDHRNSGVVHLWRLGMCMAVGGNPVELPWPTYCPSSDAPNFLITGAFATAVQQSHGSTADVGAVQRRSSSQSVISE